MTPGAAVKLRASSSQLAELTTHAATFRPDAATALALTGLFKGMIQHFGKFAPLRGGLLCWDLAAGASCSATAWRWAVQLSSVNTQQIRKTTTPKWSGGPALIWCFLFFSPSAFFCVFGCAFAFLLFLGSFFLVLLPLLILISDVFYGTFWNTFVSWRTWVLFFCWGHYTRWPPPRNVFQVEVLGQCWRKINQWLHLCVCVC